MKNIIRIVALFLASALMCFAQGKATVTKLSPTLTGTGSTNPVGLGLYSPQGNLVYSRHTVQASVTGSPTTCTYHVYGTLLAQSDSPSFPADYVDLSGAQDCGTTPMIHLVNKPVANVVVQVSALSGGTAPTVTFRYVGEE